MVGSLPTPERAATGRRRARQGESTGGHVSGEGFASNRGPVRPGAEAPSVSVSATPPVEAPKGVCPSSAPRWILAASERLACTSAGRPPATLCGLEHEQAGNADGCLSNSRSSRVVMGLEEQASSGVHSSRTRCAVPCSDIRLVRVSLRARGVRYFPAQTRSQYAQSIRPRRAQYG